MPSTPLPTAAPHKSSISGGNSSQFEQLITNEPRPIAQEKDHSTGHDLLQQMSPLSMENEVQDRDTPTSTYPHVSTSVPSEWQQQRHQQRAPRNHEESKGDNQQFNIVVSTNNPLSASCSSVAVAAATATAVGGTGACANSSSSESALNEAEGKNRRRKRKKFNEACSECRRAHKACSRTRPCERCIRLGIPQKCQSMERKKRKVTKKRWFNYQVKEDGRIAVENPQIASIKEEQQEERKNSISFVNQIFPPQSILPGMNATARTNTGASISNEMDGPITTTLQYCPYYQTPAPTSSSLEPTVTQAQQFTRQQQQQQQQQQFTQQQPRQRQFQFTDHSFDQQQAYYIPTGNTSNISGSSGNRMNFNASYPRGISGVMENSNLALQHSHLLSKPSAGQPHIFVMKTNNHQMDNTTATIDSKQSEMMTPQQSSHPYHQGNPMTLPSFNQLTGNPTYTAASQNRRASGITAVHQQQQPSFQSWTTGYQHQQVPRTDQWTSSFDTRQQQWHQQQQQQQPQQPLQPPFHNYEPYLGFMSSPSSSSTGGLNLEDQSELINQNQQKHRK